MQLTRFSDIGLRLLMYLAAEQRELPPITVAEVAGQFGIPRNHLVKVVGVLVKHGYVTALRGRTGGIRLARQPESILIGQLIRVLENKDELIPCATLECSLQQGCGLRSALKQALQVFYDALDAHTLADIAGGTTKMKIVSMQTSFLQGKLLQARIAIDN